MTSFDKKIQQGGWDKKDYKEVRNKINNFDEEDTYRKSKKDPKYCNKLKSEHDFVLVKESCLFGRIIKRFECSACGKHRLK